MSSPSMRPAAASALPPPGCRARGWWKLRSCKERRWQQGQSTTGSMQRAGRSWNCFGSSSGPRKRRWVLFGIKTEWQAAEQPLWGWCCPAQAPSPGRKGCPLPFWGRQRTLPPAAPSSLHPWLCRLPGKHLCHGLTCSTRWGCPLAGPKL